MNEVLQINPKFEQIIPPLSAEEFAQLEENILKVGRVTDPIQVWNGVIIDGHHRYKIVQKHPEIPFTTYDMGFQCEAEAVAWICCAQLGRRNISELHRAYLLGKRYEIEKKLNGGDRRSMEAKSLGQNDQVIPYQSTRARIAEDTNTTEAFVRRADEFARGVDAAEEALPGVKEKILTGTLDVQKNEVAAIAKLPVEQRKTATEQLFVPRNKRKLFARVAEIEREDGNNPETENEAESESSTPAENFRSPVPTVIEATETPADGDKRTEREIEECILDSMIGAVNMFIDSINNYLSRFPRLRTDPKYRGYTREIMVAARDYINDVEGDLI